MEIILKNDVPNLGFKDDIVTVKNGYGRNYLIPQGLAILATPSATKILAEKMKITRSMASVIRLFEDKNPKIWINFHSFFQ